MTLCVSPTDSDCLADCDPDVDPVFVQQTVTLIMTLYVSPTDSDSPADCDPDLDPVCVTHRQRQSLAPLRTTSTAVAT